MESALDHHHLRALLEWQVELGVTDAILDAPVDRYQLEAAKPAPKPIPTPEGPPPIPPPQEVDAVAIARATAAGAADLPALVDSVVPPADPERLGRAGSAVADRPRHAELRYPIVRADASCRLIAALPPLTETSAAD